MATLFISDVHLAPSHPETTRWFLQFLDTHAKQADALYILGDLFDLWIGDDAMNAFHQPIVEKLKALTQQHIPVYLMHGNHDFTISKDFLAASGCQLLDDPAVVHLYGENVLLTHGDILCADDINYQRFRRLIRQPWLLNLLLALPLKWRDQLAGKIKHTSQKDSEKKSPSDMDVNQASVETIMQKHGVNTLIHGHTHKPDTHAFTLVDKPAQRIVLGAWHNQGSALVWDSEGNKRTLIIK